MRNPLTRPIEIPLMAFERIIRETVSYPVIPERHLVELCLANEDLTLPLAYKENIIPRCVSRKEKQSSQVTQKKKGISQNQRSSLRSKGFNPHIGYPKLGDWHWEDKPVSLNWF